MTDNSETLERTCMRCEQPVSRSGRVIGGRAVCRSCAYHFKEERPCPRCAKKSKRLVFVEDWQLAVCDSCRNSRTHRTCAVCRKYRPVERVCSYKGSLCRDCAAPVPVEHACPSCGDIVPGGGNSLCEQCSIRNRVERRITFNLLLLEREWCAELFRDFCAWNGFDTTTPHAARRVDKYAGHFSELERAIQSPEQISTRALINAFGTEGLRRKQKLRDFLVAIGILHWDVELAKDMVEQRRIDAILEEASKHGRRNALASYLNWLTSGRRKPLALRTIRYYLTAAGGLMAEGDLTELGVIDQSIVDRYLRRRRGQRDSLSTFLTFLNEKLGITVSLPSARLASLVTKDRNLAQIVRQLRQGIETSSNEATIKSLIAFLLGKLYATPLEQILSLRISDVERRKSAVYIELETGKYKLDKATANAVLTLFDELEPPERYLFKGRGFERALSPAAVSYHVRKIKRAHRS